MMKRKFLKLVVILVSFLVLTSCTFEGLYLPNDPDMYPNKVNLDLCTFDTYQIEEELLGYPVETFTFESDNSIVTSVTEKGLITTYSEGVSSVLATSLINSDYNTEITINTAKGVKVDYIDVGQGDAILIILPNDEVMMIDAGVGLYYDETEAWNNIKETFNKRGIGKIDYLVMTHNHGDHYGFVPKILWEYKVENIYGSGSVRTNYEYLNIMQSIKNAGIEYNIVKLGDYFINENDLIVQVVGVQQDLNEDDGGNPNFQSVMIRIKYKKVAYMFTGDAGYQTGDCENVAINSGLDLSADILKVGHHGSMYSSGNSFLNAVKPKIAVITTSIDTETGHPHIQAVNRIKNVGAAIYQSAVNGTISVSTTGYVIYVQTEKN